LTNLPKELKRIALFTDIHFGRRGNQRQHNQDCLDFIEWFCQQVALDGGITHVAFLGDWFESRSAINIETLDYSYKGLQRLDKLGLPIFFIVGNHDLHRRTTRDVHSVRMFNEVENITIIEHPTVIDGCLFSPFLFDHEYDKLTEHNDLWAFFGHFEFKDFMITGYNTMMEHGPSHKMFPGPKRIFSGHFHKRQQQDNVVYIGNAFPMDFGDAGDNHRGAAFYDIASNKVRFADWAECPKYAKTLLSKVLDGKWNPVPKLKVKCTVDTDISYSDAQELRETMINEYDLRDFILEEDRAAKQGLLEGDTSKVTEVDVEYSDIDDLVVKQLEVALKDDAFKGKYDIQVLIDTYKDLKIEVKAKDE
jgi:DNA repair exonuclease SbcCD nuclease subunit